MASTDEVIDALIGMELAHIGNGRSPSPATLLANPQESIWFFAEDEHDDFAHSTHDTRPFPTAPALFAPLRAFPPFAPAEG